MGGGCLEEERNKTFKKIWSTERSGQKKECLNGSHLAPEAGSVLLISLGGGVGGKVVLLKIHRH